MGQSHKSLTDVAKDLRNLQAAITNYMAELNANGHRLKDKADTAGKIVEKEFIMSLPTSGVGWHYKTIVFPFGIDLIGGSYESPAGEDGDEITFSILPPVQSGIEGVVGMLNVEAASGSENLVLPAGVPPYFDEGATTITLLNTTNSDTNTRLVTGVDAGGVSIGQIDEDGSGISNPLDLTFPASTTAIILERAFGHHKLLGPRKDEMGEDAFGSSHVPAGYILKAGYYNSTSAAKKVRFIVDMFCGCE